MIRPLLRIAFVTAALLLSASGVHAQSLRNVVDELADAPAPDVAVDEANAAAHASYEAALAIYDRQVEQQPSDIMARLNRCRFMLEFASSYELADFAEPIGAQGQECMTQFEQSYPGHPETQLRQLQTNMFGEALKRGEALLEDPRTEQTWTSGQLARLYTLLARTADGEGESAEALKYALLALHFDEESNVRLIAASELIERGNKTRALEILRAPIDGADDDASGWDLSRKMRLLAQAGAPQDAFALYPRLREAPYYDHTDAAEMLIAAGAVELAREELKSAVEDGDYTMQDEGALFRLELQHGTVQAAFDAYQTWRDLGWEADPLGVNRVALLTRDASLPLRLRDFTGLLALVALGALLALVAALPIAAVHYRGLAVRARSGLPYPQSDWPLRQAWLALTAFFVSSVLALYFAGGALDLVVEGDTLWQLDLSAEQLGRVGLASGFLGITLMLPFAWSARRREGAWWSTQWSIGKCLLLGAAIAVAFRIPMLLQWLMKPDVVPSLAPDDMLWKAIRNVQEHYGLIAALWIVAVAAPVTEEFLFRGVLYRAFSAHLRPLWANLLQAALFSAMHVEDAKGTVVLFVLGLVLGTLTRRSGGLLAAMTLHATFNLIAALILMRGG